MAKLCRKVLDNVKLSSSAFSTQTEQRRWLEVLSVKLEAKFSETIITLHFMLSLSAAIIPFLNVFILISSELSEDFSSFYFCGDSTRKYTQKNYSNYSLSLACFVFLMLMELLCNIAYARRFFIFILV